MKLNGKILQLLSCTTLIMIASSGAQASTTQLFSTFANNDSANWQNLGLGLGQCVGTASAGFCTTPSFVNTVSSTPGGHTLTISFSSPNGQIWQDETTNSSLTFNGGFPVNQYLLASDDPSGTDTLTINFSTAISAFGVYIQEFDYVTQSFSASIGSDDGSTYTVGPTTTSSSPVFIGLADSGNQANIHSITITTSSSGEQGDFVIGTAIFNDGNATVVSTPEPGSILLMAGGLAALGFKLRKRARA